MNREAKELMAFMKAIEKDPVDMVTRKAFADWLEDHDEPEEAVIHREFSVEKYHAEKRLRNIADNYAYGDYEGMIKGAVEDKYYCFSSDDGPSQTHNSQFWKDIETVVGKKIDDEHREEARFRCAC